ncbi:MAG: type II toxin-antitoxin system RelE/ParE family toxin [Puniceicoccales bacterium]|nr:type II toxin-antitoxin system RelE/ParE family toxin [Puniceicoccales bacterium]
MTSPRLNKNAERDISEVLTYYAERSAQTAERFYREFDACLRKIEQTPGQYPRVKVGNSFFYNSFRRCVLKKFPYCIIYKFDSRHVEILGILHFKRSSNIWKSRLS